MEKQKKSHPRTSMGKHVMGKKKKRVEKHGGYYLNHLTAKSKFGYYI